MRVKIYSLMVLFFMLVLVGSLFYLQVGMHEKYKLMSEENRLKVVPLIAPRGAIVDRDNKALVKDVLSFNLSVVYGYVKDLKELTRFIVSEFNLPEDEVVSKIKKSRWRPYAPTVIAEDIGTEKAIQIEEISSDYPGILVEVSAKRKYIHGKTASVLLGYLGLLNRAEFDKLKHYGYRIDDLVGRSGIESYYDDYLRGKHGGKQIEVDHRGREMMTLGYKEPAPGKDVKLTIDLSLQKFCDELLTDKKGAIVAIDPRNGAIRTLASAPAYDPNIFIDRSRNSEITEVLRDRNYPLLIRANFSLISSRISF